MCFCVTFPLQSEHIVYMKRLRSFTVQLLALCLALSLCLTAVGPASAAGSDTDTMLKQLMAVFGVTQSDYDNYNRNYAASLPIEYEQKSSSHYVALGGATAGGFAVVGTSNAYAKKVAASRSIKYTPLALYDLTAAGVVSYIQDNASDIATADLITLQLDAAPFILASYNNTLGDVQVNWKKYISDNSLIASLTAYRNQLVAEYSVTYGKQSAEKVALMVEHLLYECVAYSFEMINATNEIRKYNSKAVVLLPGLYNPLRNLAFSNGGQVLDIGGLMDQMIDYCNVFLLKRTSSMAKTAFVDVSDASTAGFKTVTLNSENPNAIYSELSSIVTDSRKQYANQDGHDHIRDKVLQALVEPCKHTKTTVKDARPASCKTEGYTGDTVCASCGVTIARGTTIQKTTDHKYGSWTQTKAPSCLKEGEQTRTCSVCGKKETKSIAATGHSWNSGTVTTKPSCEKTGVKTISCTNSGCTATKTETVSATGHSWNSGTVTTKPGCETKGTKTTSCTNSGCTETKTEVIAATGHSWDKGSVTVKPGCETKGEKAVTCTVCKKATTEIIPATGHTWDKGTVILEPGCETKGEKALNCTVCGKATTEPIPATGHTWDKGTVLVKPRCETEGEKAFTCTVCSKTVTEPIPATGHTWDEGVVITKPGCETDGEKNITCTVCSKAEIQPIPATGHTWNEGTVITKPGCETQGEKAITCVICGKETTEPISATGHTYGDYQSNNDATCEKDGTKTASCINCDAIDTVDDPGSQKEHNYSDNVCTFCGAEKPANYTIWWVLGAVLVVAAAGGGVLVFLKRKKRPENSED